MYAHGYTLVAWRDVRSYVYANPICVREMRAQRKKGPFRADSRRPTKVQIILNTLHIVTIAQPECRDCSLRTIFAQPQISWQTFNLEHFHFVNLDGARECDQNFTLQRLTYEFEIFTSVTLLLLHATSNRCIEHNFNKSNLLLD